MLLDNKDLRTIYFFMQEMVADHRIVLQFDEGEVYHKLWKEINGVDCRTT
jgi:hypothetical protein